MKLKNKFIYLSVSTFSLITPITVSACSTTKYPMLTDYTNNPTAVGADQTLLDALDFYINERVWEGSKSSINKSSANPSTSLAFPSIQISAAKDNKIFYQKTFGYAYMYKDGQSADIGGTGGTVGDLLPDEQRVKATNETMYDLASNTKMYAGMFAIQFLIQNHKIGSLDDKVSKYIPEFNHQFANVPVSLNSEEKGSMNLQDITIYNLLTHTSGLKASPYDYIVSASKDCVDGNKHKVRDFDGLLLALILIEPDFIFGNDQQYSDIDFMLVDLLVNRITGQRIDQFNQNNIYHPLGLKHTMYNPLKREISLSNLAATELQGNTRQGLRNDTPDDFTDMRKVQIRGEVHDEVSYYSMNGISGHAGLFSTAGELNILQSIMLNGGGYGNHRFFDQSLIDKVITPIANPKDPNNFQFGIG
jgi:CubicO group peptidase (beta-lactamase class C family)